MRELAVSGRLLRATLAGALLIGAVALAAPRSAQPAPTAQSSVTPTSLDLTVLRDSQQAILGSGSLKVRVRSARPGLATLKGSAQAGDASPTPIAKRKRVSFSHPGAKKVTLKLTGTGRALLSQCSDRDLVFTGKLRRGKEASAPGVDRAFATQSVSLDAPTCAATGGLQTGSGTDTGGGGSGGGGSGGGGGDGGGGHTIPPEQPYTGPPIDTSNGDRCDFLDPAVCLEPWPNDYFTVADPNTDTGRRLNLNGASTPKNSPLSLPLGLIPIDPTDQNRADGFSPGNMIIARIPGLDNPGAFEQTGAVGVDDMASYADPDQPVVVINADTGERQPIWAEIDSNPIDPAVGGDPNDPADRAKVNLIIRPAVNFDEGGHYIVALRDLKDENGSPIVAANAFKVYRDNLTTTDPAIEGRRPHMEDLFANLEDAGIQRSNLYLTWDFTVASEHSLTSRALHIRDEAFSQLGDTDLSDMQVQGNSPSFSVTNQQDLAAADNANIARIVKGTVTVPCYLNNGCSPLLSSYNLGPDGLPQQNGTTTAQFECIIPRVAIDGPDPEPSRVSLYGHGLLGSLTEVEAGNVEAMANEHDVTFCATDWFGFANQNLPNVLLILQDVSRFNTLVDQTQQGFLNFLFLGRTMIHPSGLVANAAFQSGGQPVIDNSHLYYDGNSQGGILGGALTALAPDFNRAVLGVPAMNYSTLLERSVDFEPYAEGKFTSEICGLLPLDLLKQVCNLLPQDTPLGLYDNYPNQLERPLIFSLMQLLWDRGEPDGYAHHMTTDPLPNSPPHEVLMDAAFGDHQVANVAAEVEARTIGASIYQPALEPGRYWDPSGVFGIPEIESFPHSGSALVYWDGGPPSVAGGTATPPNGDLPPRPTIGCGPDGTQGCGADPHSYPRSDIKARAQKSDFLMPDGAVNNYCTTANSPDPGFDALVPNTGTPIPCHSHGWTGP